MTRVLLSCLFFLGGAALVRAGSVVTISDGSETTGPLTFTASTIHVETTPSPAEINFTDILSATFGETPFHLDYFSGNDNGGNQLPPTWKQQDIGTVSMPGSITEKDGTFTLEGSGSSPKPNDTGGADSLFFAGRPWTGDGQWTARVKDIDAQTPDTEAGVMLRDTLDAGSPLFLLGAMTLGNGLFGMRAEAGKQLQQGATPIDIPGWLRLTRYGTTIFASTSTDGNDWDVVWQNNLKTSATPWIGLFASSHKDKVLGNAVIDDVSFTPAPSSAQILPCGVLLQSGTFFAGTFNSLEFDPAKPDASGSFNLNGKGVAIAPSKIAAVILLPTPRSQIAEMGSHIGLLMKNGDFMDGPPRAIGGTSVRVSSIALGITTYSQCEVRACFLHPLVAPTAKYEVRLRDGSIVNADEVSGDKDNVVMQDASGLTVTVAAGDVAQFRAGPSQVQSMAELDWKATSPPPATNTAVPSVTVAAPGATNAAPAANAVPNPPPAAQCWEGNNQEQIIEAPVGATIEFPLTGKFHAIAMRIAVAPDSPPNSSLAVRVLAGGREATSPVFKAGDQPRFWETPISSPGSVTLEAGSIFAGPKVLLIDPVAIRDTSQ